MKFAGKKILFVDIETTGLPITRKSVRRFDKYPSPSINIAYDRSRLLSISAQSSQHAVIYNAFRDESDLTDECYTANKGKYDGRPGKVSIKEIIDKSLVYFKECDFVVGHNVLFDINIIANEYYRIYGSLSPVLESIISESRYFCTLMMAQMLGIEDRNISLESVIAKLADPTSLANLFGSAGSANFYHESANDVAATKLIFEIGSAKLDSIPDCIHELTDSIYAPIHYDRCHNESHNGSAVDTLAGCTQLCNRLCIRTSETAFRHYYETLKPESAKYYASGKAEFFGELQNLNINKLMTVDGLATHNDRVADTLWLVDSNIYYCDICGDEMLGSSVCSKHNDEIDSIFRSAQEFATMTADYTDFMSVAELKIKIRDIGNKSRRSGIVNLETQKKGRSLILPANKVNFYIDQRIYLYFGIKVGSTKL